MKWNCEGRGVGRMKIVYSLLAATLAVALTGTSAMAQAEHPAEKPDAGTVEQTFYLSNVSQQNDFVEINNTIRSLLDPKAKVVPVAGQNAILIRATPDELKLAQKLLSDLDKPKKTYRL